MVLAANLFAACCLEFDGGNLFIFHGHLLLLLPVPSEFKQRVNLLPSLLSLPFNQRKRVCVSTYTVQG